MSGGGDSREARERVAWAREESARHAKDASRAQELAREAYDRAQELARDLHARKHGRRGRSHG